MAFRIDIYHHFNDDEISRHMTRIERKIDAMAQKVADLDAVLDRIEGATSKLGQDLKDVFTAIKNNPGGDLTAEVTRGNNIADALIQADADTLAELDPIPVPPVT